MDLQPVKLIKSPSGQPLCTAQSNSPAGPCLLRDARRAGLGRLLCALLLASSTLAQAQSSDTVADPGSAATDSLSGFEPTADTTRSEASSTVPQPGQCWVYGAINPKPVEQQIEVPIKDTHARIQVTPAEIRQGYKKVVTREGTLTYRIEPPTYRTVEEKIMVRPPVEHFIVVPAEFETQMRTVTLDSEHQMLEPCNSNAHPELPQSFCVNEYPARAQQVPVQVLVKPETTKVVIEPAQYKTVRRQVIDRPARVIEVWHEPAEEVLPAQEVAMPAHTSQTLVPAETHAFKRTDYEGKPQLALRQAVCEADLSTELVRTVQKHLKAEGYLTTAVDGLLGKDTISALHAYQFRHGLVSSGLTFETLEQMGIEPPR